MKVLEFSEVKFGYGKELVLDRVSLEVMKGDFFGLIGPNGAGKSTLLKLALGLEKPWNGHVKLFGKEKFSDWRRVGYVPQRPTSESNFPATVSEVVAMGINPLPGPFGLTGEQKRRVEESLIEVGMDGKKDARAGDLSGGQLQRVLLARALVGKPDLLMLDEPTAGIDSTSQEKFCCLLERLNKEGMTIVLVSHDMSFMSYLVNKVACVNRNVHFCGKPSALSSSGALQKAYGHAVKIVAHHHTHEAGNVS